eukprot:gene25343-31789_t
MERQGNQRWLVVSRSADKLWDPLREFWTSNGFVLVTDSPEVGIMETEWAENRAKLPQDFIRKTLGKVLDSLYSTGERDKFRTRIERNAQGGVEIYITHRGMVEDYADAQKTKTIWKPRATDPELEIEFLRRLMVKLGASPEKAKAETLTARAPKGIEVTTVDGQPTLALTDSMDRAWRRTGVALDRSGFTVEDRDRAKGIYFVRYVAPGTADKEPGFFARLFSSPKEVSTLSRYRIALSDKGNDSSQIRVLNAAGQAESTANASTILKLIANEPSRARGADMKKPRNAGFFHVRPTEVGAALANYLAADASAAGAAAADASAAGAEASAAGAGATTGAAASSFLPQAAKAAAAITAARTRDLFMMIFP